MGGFIFNFCLFTNTLTIDSLPFLDWHKLQHHHRSSCYHSQQNMIQFCPNFQILKTSKVDIQSFSIHITAKFYCQYFVMLFKKKCDISWKCNWALLKLTTETGPFYKQNPCHILSFQHAFPYHFVCCLLCCHKSLLSLLKQCISLAECNIPLKKTSKLLLQSMF